MIAKLLLQRGLALVYCIAFLVALNQFRALLGERGLLPVPLYLKQVRFLEAPSLFHFAPHDWAFTSAAALGLVLSLLALAGLPERLGAIANALWWLTLWVLYLSFVNVGQVFYAFGWESMLLEAGFLAVFLGPAGTHPPPVVIWLFRWMIFRVMFGAGLIKLRGDPCWRDFTCLFYHFETQPLPAPMSWFFHWLPRWFLKLGVGFNHFVEVLVPFGFFIPRWTSTVAAIVTILFQLMLLVSGNFAFLTLLTIVLATSGLDDDVLRRFLPLAEGVAPPPERLVTVSWLLALLIGVLSIRPALNLLSPRQAMNATYDPLHLVGTYGAFGSITRPRYEVIVEGTLGEPASDNAVWQEYAFKAKPGAVDRMPPQIAPYHLRLDWLMWFAAFSDWRQQPWFVHLLMKLLDNDPATLDLMGPNPFPTQPPKYVRAQLYEYAFTTPAERARTGAWWRRKLVGEYFPPVAKGGALLERVSAIMDWNDAGK